MTFFNTWINLCTYILRKIHTKYLNMYQYPINFTGIYVHKHKPFLLNNIKTSKSIRDQGSNPVKVRTQKKKNLSECLFDCQVNSNTI